MRCKEFGPPCEEKAPSGRYNKQHEPVLYLCDVAAGVRCELRHRKADGKLCCQQYLIPSGSMRIVDFSQGKPGFLGTQVLSVAEERSSGSRDAAYPLFSQTVAEIVRDEGYDGMVARGAQGKSGDHYRNIVIFDPWLDRRWITWLAPSTEPIVLDPL
ncbi:RES domain-containing protein [Candidatus Bipolaricaulota bacterium]